MEISKAAVSNTRPAPQVEANGRYLWLLPYAADIVRIVYSNRPELSNDQA
jgi:hypothetical protein